MAAESGVHSQTDCLFCLFWTTLRSFEQNHLDAAPFQPSVYQKINNGRGEKKGRGAINGGTRDPAGQMQASREPIKGYASPGGKFRVWERKCARLVASRIVSGIGWDEPPSIEEESGRISRALWECRDWEFYIGQIVNTHILERQR